MKMNQFLQMNKGEKYYYINREVNVLNIYRKLNLVKIKMIDTGKEIIIDASAISLEPIYENTISINILGGELR